MRLNLVNSHIEIYQRKIQEAYKVGRFTYRTALKTVLYDIVRNRNTGFFTEEEAQVIWRSVLPSIGTEEYGGISESFGNSGSYRIAFDAADELAAMLSAYRGDR